MKIKTEVKSSLTALVQTVELEMKNLYPFKTTRKNFDKLVGGWMSKQFQELHIAIEN
jgi:hypothetical protein